MVSLREAMDRLFEESFLRPDLFGGGETPASALPLDMYETENDVVVKASVPGVKPEDIEVTVTGDLLTIKGEFKSEEKTEKQNFIRQERRYGSFCRQLGLSTSVDSGKAEASFENGILTLTLPKVEAVKPKTVRVVAK
jgi:HSP20 family protein